MGLTIKKLRLWIWILCFVRDRFYRYRQFEILDEGTYEHIYDDVYRLSSNIVDEYIIYTNDKLHYFDREINDILYTLKSLIKVV